MAILQTRELKKYYGAGDTLVKALDGVELSVENGEFVAIIGTSGSGKSTLLHMLGGLDRPTSGTVTVDGRELSTLKDEELTIFRRRKIGFVFQNYNLVPVLNVYENIVLPIQLDGGKVDQSYVNQVIEALGLEQRLNSLPSQLHDFRISISTPGLLPLFPALFEQPHSGDILQETGCPVYAAFVCEIMAERFFRDNRLFRLDPHQAPGSATQVGELFVLCGDGSNSRSRVMSGNRHNGHLAYPGFFSERIGQLSH